MRSPMALRPSARCVGEWLERWARETPQALALAQRDARGEHWCRVSYGELRRDVGALAQSLLDLHLPAGRPIAILSDNAIDHAVPMLAAMHVGITPCFVFPSATGVADSSRLEQALRAAPPGRSC
ncbi:hypothetical protein D5041_06235 [Verminephrobacter aporrectodeae subsp. tuberculatae]|uniref:AMP-binding protein n=1 Tax=Verminephrobacter aporrectodeae TaxID=1110389 RepID=UPI00223783C5|nr:AMP-binding protein [Verminephrobacter aporrectodeae]MCW5223204.1 hypothetical protein [Verminephrobacter aporrectodeae subsp. tuberculatae]MCW5288668.1 hypothetical protein [Verminephrobacter aporrectodeae subsp. tuberculatae]